MTARLLLLFVLPAPVLAQAGGAGGEPLPQAHRRAPPAQTAQRGEEPEEPLAPQNPEDEEDEGEIAPQSNARVGFGIGFAKALGSMGRAVDAGMGGHAWFGYQIDMHDFLIVPRFSIAYVHFFTGETEPVGIPTATDASTITVFPGVIFTVRTAVRPWVGVGIGYGRVSISDSGGGLSGSSIDSAFGVGLQGGIEVRLLGSTVIGLTADYTRVSTEIQATQWLTFGLGVTFGL